MTPPTKGGICRSCGGATGLSSRGAPRAYCDAEACQRAKHRAAAAVFREKRRAAPPPTEWECPACGEVKPLTYKHWSVRDWSRKDRSFWDSLCRPCKAVDQRLRYESDPARQAMARERTQAYRERVLAHRRADPEYDRAFREHKAELERKRRARVKPEPVEVDPDEPGWGRLPAKPLADALERWLCDSEDSEVPLKALGLDARFYYAWRTGERDTLTFARADRALTGMELNWWDVWDPATYPEVAEFFEGPPRKRLERSRLA